MEVEGEDEVGRVDGDGSVKYAVGWGLQGDWNRELWGGMAEAAGVVRVGWAEWVLEGSAAGFGMKGGWIGFCRSGRGDRWGEVRVC